jgi:hypothetical protein
MRSRVLLSKIKELLSPPEFLPNPFLCSQIASSKRVSVSIIASLPVLRTFRASYDEIMECCRRSPFLDVIRSHFISPNFEIRPQCIVLRQASSVGSAFEVRDFIHSLKGDVSFGAFPTNDG